MFEVQDRVINTLLLSLLISPSLDACDARPGDRYEQIYCQVVEKIDNHNLPSLDDFRRNERDIQRLILKRPARQLGIEVPQSAASFVDPAVVERDVVAKSTAANKPSEVKKSPPKLIAETKSNTTNAPTDTEISSAKLATAELAVANIATVEKSLPMPTALELKDRCQLSDKAISCGGDIIYQLVENRAVGELSAQVLNSDNKMSLPAFEGEISNKNAVQEYLQQAYKKYLAKMIEVGLGGSTMTFNKFAYIFHDAHERDFDFVARFEMMFDFLKKDKQQSGGVTQDALDDGLSIEFCGEIGEETIVCSKTARNRVYMRKT